MVGVRGGCLGCQEQGVPQPPARRVVGVAASHDLPESLHLEADQSPEEPVNEMMYVYPVHSPESLHPEAGQASGKGASSSVLVLVLWGAWGALGGVEEID